MYGAITLRFVYANDVLDIQCLFSLVVHLSVVAWTSPRAPSGAVLDIIATNGVRNISFSQYVHVSLFDICKIDPNSPGNNSGTISTPSCGRLFAK